LVRLSQIRPIYTTFVQVISDIIRLGKVISGYLRLGYFISVYFRLGLINSG